MIRTASRWYRIAAAATCLFLFAAATRAAVEAIPTFHSLGLYWSDSGGSKDTICDVRYREAGSSAWRIGLPLWFDARAVGADTDARRPAGEYRGSLVNLRPGTAYEVELSLRGTAMRVALTAKTWSEKFPVAKTVELPEHSNATLVITESGSPDGYILYAPAPGRTATIDIANRHPYGVQIHGAYVIVRGVTIKNAARDGICLEDTHDVVIEDCDISGWGRLDADAGVLGPTSDVWGMNGDAGIYSRSKTLTRVIIQRNRIHDPRTDTNNWSERRELYQSFHPRGPQGIYLIDTAGHLVIRYNEFGTDNDHRFNDIVAGNANFSWRGFPNRDSDIYGNKLHHCWDDGIEAEGGNCNVRIWGNYLTECYTGIATAATSVGPIYVFRNIYDVRARVEGRNSEYGPFAKLGDNHPRFGGGRRYFFHNTLLQQPALEGSPHTLGAGGALSGSTSERPMVDVVSRNNIWQLHRPDRTAYISGHPATRDNDIDHDLTQGAAPRLFGPTHRIGPHMIVGVPDYAWGNGPESRDGGKYMLTSTSPGYDAGELLPNFSDGFTGIAPDVGAHEASTAPLEFGVNAYRKGLPMASPTGVGPIRRTTYTYKKVGSLEIKADVHRLDDRDLRPVLVWIHGGALMGGGRERFSSTVHRLINDGVIVVTIDYRLAPETKLPAIIEDLEDAFKWLHARGPDLFQADVKRVGVWGHSAGGYLALTSGFRVKPAPQVLVSAYGYGDLIGDWYSTPSPHAGHRRIVMSEAQARAQVTGAPVANNRDRRGNASAFYELCRQKGFWPEAVSGWDPRREAEKFHPFMAVKNVTPQYPPTFLLHGTADTDVPHEQSVMMAAEFKKHGVPHAFVSLQNGEHDFSGADPALVDRAWQDALAFVKKHLDLR
jgi:acetyl esterase/lipase